MHTLAFNWPLDAFNYQLQLGQWWLIFAWIAGIVSMRGIGWALRWPFYETFTFTAAFAFGYPVLIFYAWGVDVLPEFELFLFLALFAFFRFGLTSAKRVRQVCAAAVLLPLTLGGWAQLKRYLTQGYEQWKPLPASQVPEYKLAKWLQEAARPHPGIGKASLPAK